MFSSLRWCLVKAPLTSSWPEICSETFHGVRISPTMECKLYSLSPTQFQVTEVFSFQIAFFFFFNQRYSSRWKSDPDIKQKKLIIKVNNKWLWYFLLWFWCCFRTIQYFESNHTIWLFYNYCSVFDDQDREIASSSTCFVSLNQKKAFFFKINMPRNCLCAPSDFSVIFTSLRAKFFAMWWRVNITVN